MGNRCLTTALFIKDVDDIFDSCIDIARYPDHGRLLHCLLTSTIKHMGYRRSAVESVINWNLFKF
jgi:hypothetical protein